MMTTQKSCNVLEFQTELMPVNGTKQTSRRYQSMSTLKG
jgi:hypothetical protein